MKNAIYTLRSLEQENGQKKEEEEKKGKTMSQRSPTRRLANPKSDKNHKEYKKLGNDDNRDRIIIREKAINMVKEAHTNKNL